jgi:hypothetical protein
VEKGTCICVDVIVWNHLSIALTNLSALNHFLFIGSLLAEQRFFINTQDCLRRSLLYWPYSKPLRSAVGGAWLFCLSACESKLSPPPNKKASRLASGGFVTSSGFKPETF